MIKFYPADEEHSYECNVIAKLSPFTRDFANPPLSLKSMRQIAFAQREVIIAKHSDTKQILGFVWARPMKPKHMPFSTIYYMSVRPEWRRKGVAQELLFSALSRAKQGRIELVCEHANKEAFKFYQEMNMKVLRQGFVGKDNRPFTRFYLEAEHA